LNPQPTDYKSVALPIELHQLAEYLCLSDSIIIIHYFYPFRKVLYFIYLIYFNLFWPVLNL